MMHEGVSAAHNEWITARVPWLDIDADEPTQINLDGEPIAVTRFHFEVLPRRLALKLPPDCPLLG
jgi:diacylglycerol kinase family enzyme